MRDERKFLGTDKQQVTKPCTQNVYNQPRLYYLTNERTKKLETAHNDFQDFMNSSTKSCLFETNMLVHKMKPKRS